MNTSKDFDWATGTAEAQLEAARRASPDQLCDMVREYDWRLFPEEVLGWVMAQKSIDLGSALTCFFNGDPERFNYLPKRDVPAKFRGVTRVLDNICLRVNSGFYLSLPARPVKQTKRLANWLTYQQQDRVENLRGRWILDERILDTLDPQTLKLPPDAAAAPKAEKYSLLRDVLSPVAGLGVQREYLKYLPDGK